MIQVTAGNRSRQVTALNVCVRACARGLAPPAVTSVPGHAAEAHKTTVNRWLSPAGRGPNGDTAMGHHREHRQLPPAVELEVRRILRAAGRRLLIERQKAARSASSSPPADTVKT